MTNALTKRMKEAQRARRRAAYGTRPIVVYRIEGRLQAVALASMADANTMRAKAAFARTGRYTKILAVLRGAK